MPQAKCYRLLVVADDPEEVAGVVLALEHDVLTATTPQAALRLLEEHRIDLIVADQLTTMSGVELLRRSIEINPDCVRILLTPHRKRDLALDAIDRGEVSGFVRTPWDPREIRITVRQGLERLKDHRALEEQNAVLTKTQAELEEAQEELARFEQMPPVGRLIAEVIHDIGNALICMYSVAVVELERHTDKPMVVATLARLRDTNDEIQGMLLEMCAFAQGREVPLETSECWVADVIDEVVHLARYVPTLSERSIDREYVERPLAPINATKIKRVLFDLLQNAGHATEAGDVIRIELRRVEDWVQISVVDRGCGISADDLERVWEPFYTSDPETGAGLGLAVCKRVVEQHGGRISCESEVGVGTTFRILLPGSAGSVWAPPSGSCCGEPAPAR